MSSQIAPQSRAPFGLRLIHAATFSCFAAAAVFWSRSEWAQLWRSQVQPYHVGEPPRLVALTSSLAAALAGTGLILCFMLKRSVPIALSVVVLMAGVVMLFVEASGGTSPRYMVTGNLQALQIARDLAHYVLTKSKGRGLPNGITDWNDALAFVVRGRASPFRSRNFAPISYAIRFSEGVESRFVSPGTILISRNSAGHPKGIAAVGGTADGRAAVISGPAGEPIMYELGEPPVESKFAAHAPTPSERP